MSKITHFFSEVKTELSKVSWSSKDDLITSTIVVLCSVAFLAVFIGCSDFIISKVVNVIIR